MNLVNEKIHAELVTTEAKETMEGIYRLRNRVYAKEKGWAPDQSTGMEQDHYDNQNSIYVAVSAPVEDGAERVMGCLRAIPLSFKVMLDDEFRSLIPGGTLIRESAIEITRIAVDKEYRRKGIDLYIYRELVRWSRENNIIHWYFAVEPKYLLCLNRLGIEAVNIGEKFIFPDGVEVLAGYIDLPKVLEKLAINNPKLYRFIMD